MWSCFLKTEYSKNLTFCHLKNELFVLKMLFTKLYNSQYNSARLSKNLIIQWDSIFSTRNLLHWDTKLDSIRRLLLSRPHQSQKPVGSEDPQLGVSQLVERVAETRHETMKYFQMLKIKLCKKKKIFFFKSSYFLSDENKLFTNV